MNWESVYQAAVLETDWSNSKSELKLQILRLRRDYRNFPSTTAAPSKKIKKYRMLNRVECAPS